MSLARWASPGIRGPLANQTAGEGGAWVGRVSQAGAAVPAAREREPSQQSMQDVSDVWQPLHRLFHRSVGFSEHRLLHTNHSSASARNESLSAKQRSSASVPILSCESHTHVVPLRGRRSPSKMPQIFTSRPVT